MPTDDPNIPHCATDEWRGDFASSRDAQLDAWAGATPSQRLRWLEEALAFAHRMGALPERERD